MKNIFFLIFSVIAYFANAQNVSLTSPGSLLPNSSFTAFQPNGSTTNVSVEALVTHVIDNDTLAPSGKIAVLDYFTETAATLLDAHTPNVGTSWTQAYTEGPTFTIGANAGTVGPTATGTDLGVYYIEQTPLALPDYEVSSEITAGSTSSNVGWVLFRYVDTNNYYAVKLSTTANTSRIVKKVGGTFTNLGSTFTLAIGTINVKIIGDLIVVTNNGNTVQTVSDASLSAAGKVGIGTGDIGQTSTDDTNTAWKWTALKVQYYGYLASAIDVFPIADFYADVSNSGTSETDLFTKTTIANRLNTPGDKLIGDFSISLTDNTSTATIRCYYAGTKFFDSGAITVTTTGYATVRMVVVRTGSTTARAYSQLVTGSNAVTGYTQETDITGLTFTNTNIIKVTAQAGGAGGGSGDIVGKLGTITFACAAQ